MSATILWLIGAFAVLGAEMLIGTIYLLAVSAALFAAALFSYLDYSLTVQCSVAAVVTCIGAIGTYFLRTKRKSAAEDVRLDEGNKVIVNKVNIDGSAYVNYRGAKWLARAKEGQLDNGIYIIAEIDGNELVLTKKN